MLAALPLVRHMSDEPAAPVSSKQHSGSIVHVGHAERRTLQQQAAALSWRNSCT